MREPHRAIANMYESKITLDMPRALSDSIASANTSFELRMLESGIMPSTNKNGWNNNSPVSSNANTRVVSQGYSD